MEGEFQDRLHHSVIHCREVKDDGGGESTNNSYAPLFPEVPLLEISVCIKKINKVPREQDLTGILQIVQHTDGPFGKLQIMIPTV